MATYLSAAVGDMEKATYDPDEDGVIADAQISNALTVTGMAKIVVGTFTGDGALSHAITGVGFQPKNLVIYKHITGNAVVGTSHLTTDDFVSTGFIYHVGNIFTHYLATDSQSGIRSLDADGFTVGDGGGDADPNKLNQQYDYVAWS